MRERPAARIDGRDGCVGVRFLAPRGRGRACPARGFPISARFPYTAGPHICGPYTAAIFYHAATANVPGTVKTVPYKAPVNPICREGS